MGSAVAVRPTCGLRAAGKVMLLRRDSTDRLLLLLLLMLLEQLRGTRLGPRAGQTDPAARRIHHELSRVC